MDNSFSFLNWPEALKYLPVSDEVRKLANDVDWKLFQWQVIGLPETGAKYSFLDNKLYLDETGTGLIKTEVQDLLSGNVYVGGYLVNKDENGDNFFIVFNVLIIKGVFSEASVEKEERHSNKEYQTSIKYMHSAVIKNIKQTKTFWYKYLYRPYSFCIRGTALGIVFVMEFIYKIVMFVAKKLTPLG